ncbi:hypothetical protein K502DRAFT_359215 [Neoconidiobolus thromboides FSU 785]|nr:hypothetical protein K502DRAFT_359215 [Neoconidiobolus thromboides FSU 785]
MLNPSLFLTLITATLALPFSAEDMDTAPCPKGTVMTGYKGPDDVVYYACTAFEDKVNNKTMDECPIGTVRTAKVENNEKVFDCVSLNSIKAENECPRGTVLTATTLKNGEKAYLCQKFESEEEKENKVEDKTKKCPDGLMLKESKDEDGKMSLSCVSKPAKESEANIDFSTNPCPRGERLFSSKNSEEKESLACVSEDIDLKSEESKKLCGKDEKLVKDKDNKGREMFTCKTHSTSPQLDLSGKSLEVKKESNNVQAKADETSQVKEKPIDSNDAPIVVRIVKPPIQVVNPKLKEGEVVRKVVVTRKVID